MAQEEAKLAATADAGYVQVESRFFHRIFWIFAVMAALSLLISFGGREIGSRLSMGGHTDDLTLHEIVIGNDVLSVTANRIRYPEQRRDGVSNRLDLYVKWPSMDGFTEASRAAFNNANGNKELLFLSFEPRTLSRDMSGRLDPIYRKMISGDGEALANGLVRYRLPESAGFVDEFLLVGAVQGGNMFVARCLDESKAGATLASCDRDVHVGDDLVMMARFPSSLLTDWKSLKQSLDGVAAAVVKTSPTAIQQN
jgi:hypothetical protein